MMGQMAGTAWAGERGPQTGLPLPRFVSLKAREANVRRGPSLSHRIDWVFQRRGMPLQVVGEYEHWRRVQDQDGVGGWVHYMLLSGARTGLVETDLAGLYASADTRSLVKAHLEAGVIVSIERCKPAWCRVRAEGIKGWVEKKHIWGVTSEEVFP
ncbi:MAG: aspartyl-trna synthetase [Rhodobacterales bacterium]|nr:MAG: aspartyl-trna synthetase [Rhodobacterales bacterium]